MQSNHQYSRATPLGAEHRPIGGTACVFFHTNLPVQVNKQKDHPTYLRQLALEIINDIPVDAVKVYTDGSRNDSGCTGSIFTNPTLIELRQEIGQYHWLRGAVTSFSVLARSVRQS
ncbi:hypothetical protein AVEN_203177-1 [Araneus ventricosus]|uniref:RNase H type-1 domain-containing protein n=1 Tax=Araneus ventricosus TaxID=182803 RepID=A0A4Y2CI79_ARAVE|nr:hypothetical protein AVEN_203177-1 [Araneus ventricosus]